MADEQSDPTHTEEGIEVHFDPEYGYLKLSCGEGEFQSLCRAICEQARLEDVVGEIEHIRNIEIELGARPPSAFKMAIGRFLCYAIMGALVLFLMVGAVTVINWLGRVFH